MLSEISPTMNLMEDAPEIEMNQNSIVDEEFTDKLFENGLINAKRTVQCIF